MCEGARHVCATPAVLVGAPMCLYATAQRYYTRIHDTKVPVPRTTIATRGQHAEMIQGQM